MTNEFDMSNKIISAVDAAHPVGMISDDAHTLELNTRLNKIALEFMATRPELATQSLDDWTATNADILTDAEYRDAVMLIEAY
jgi:hypothetical protein